MTYADYPDTAKNNARRALDHKKNGSNCGTRVGWLRANQIANGEGLSEDTVQRTYSFLSRAETYDQGKYFDEDGNEICGSIMYDAWGGSAMRDWAEAKFKKIEREKESKAMAKFNIDTRQSDSFIGLPTPAMSLFVLSLPLITQYSDVDFVKDLIKNNYFLIGVTFVLSYLMHAELHLFSLKFKDYSIKNNSIKYIFLSISIILIGTIHFLSIPIIIVIYVLLSLIKKVFPKKNNQ